MAALVAAVLSCDRQQVRETNDSGHDMDDMSHMEGVNERGDKVMGFAHNKTTHHFKLLVDGGSIEVAANDANDTASRDQIRQHLNHIVQMFSEGDFNAPMLIHGQEPSGVPTIKRLKGDINYRFEEMDLGGRVRISTANVEALSAIHDFLRFQINDHKTGDPTEVTSSGTH